MVSDQLLLQLLLLQRKKKKVNIIHLSSFRFGGNNFHVGNNSPPWDFPLQTQATAIEQNIPAPPATQSSAIAKNPSKKLGGHKKKRIGPGGIAFLVGGGTLVASCVALYIAVRINQSRAQRLITLGSSNSSMHSLSVRNTTRGKLSLTFILILYTICQ